MLPGTATEFTVTFPPLAEGDAWFVYLSEVRLDALDATGRMIGGQLGGGVAEAMCTRPVPTFTPAPSVSLPATGTGQTPGDSRAWIYGAVTGWLLIVLAAGLIKVSR
jgi:hypothetical protein